MKATKWVMPVICPLLNMNLVAAHQSASATNPVLEVASVRRNTSGTFQQAIIMQPGGTLAVTNFLVSQLIPIAYGVQQSQVVGGPGWIREERYDIIAKHAAPTSSREMLRTLLRAVLAERFTLTAHTEKRDQAVYLLVPARPDRRPGERLQPVATGCGAAAFF